MWRIAAVFKPSVAKAPTRPSLTLGPAAAGWFNMSTWNLNGSSYFVLNDACLADPANSWDKNNIFETRHVGA